MQACEWLTCDLRSSVVVVGELVEDAVEHFGERVDLGAGEVVEEVALYGLGPDGLEVPRGIAAAAARLLVPGGLFVMEHAETQGEAVRLMFAAVDAFESIATLADLTGRDRMTIARRR